MKFNLRSFFGRLMVSYIAIILISLVIIGIIFGYLIQHYYFGLREWKATNNGKRIAELVSNNVTGRNLRSSQIKGARQRIETIARSANMDIGIVDKNGKFIFNSTNLSGFSLRIKPKEIERVLEGNSIIKKIRGPKNKSLLMIFPLLLKANNQQSIVMKSDILKENQIMGGIIVRSQLGSVTETIHEIIRLIFYSSLIAVIAAIGFSFLFARRVTKPLERINKSALEITEGNFEQVVLPENSSQEIERLIDTFNYAVEQVDQTLHKKERLEKMRKQFVADVSHEFRAPLTSIKGFLEILQDQELTKEERDNYIKIMYDDTAYLEHLISDLSVLGKLDSDNLELEREVVNIRKIISRAINSLQYKLKDKKIKIKKSAINDLPELYVDINRLHQVMVNLLENAISYSPVGGEIKIEVREKKQPKGKISFSIIDQGPGVPEEEKEKIWQRFYKVDSARTRQKRKGSGLGLAIVKDIIEKHGGRVKVENVVNGGAKFTFVLPKNAIIYQ